MLSSLTKTGALVGLVRTAPYFLVLAAAHLWNVTVLYVVALTVLIRLFLLDLDGVSELVRNRSGVIVLALATVRLLLLLVADVPWAGVLSLGFDNGWIVSIMLVLLVLIGYVGLGLVQSRILQRGSDGQGLGDAPESAAVMPSELSRRTRSAIGINLALGRREFAVEHDGVTYEVEAGVAKSVGSSGLLGRVALYVLIAASLAVTALLWQMLRVDARPLAVVGGLAMLGFCAGGYALLSRRRLTASIDAARVVALR